MNPTLATHEQYRYAREGTRLLKSSRQATKAITRRQQVRYLPGLEIRTKVCNRKQTENLLVITVNGARILHWQQGKPDSLNNNQIHYSADDRSGSAQLELDGAGKIISREQYYPFGGTALWATRNQTEASYKTIRYSGKERDATGLYYYGYRYYAPWLMRWLNADPAGTVDGFNVYQMVRNNPVSLMDVNGLISFSKLFRAAWSISLLVAAAFRAMESPLINDASGLKASTAGTTTIQNVREFPVPVAIGGGFRVRDRDSPEYSGTMGAPWAKEDGKFDGFISCKHIGEGGLISNELMSNDRNEHVPLGDYKSFENARDGTDLKIVRSEFYGDQVAPLVANADLSQSYEISNWATRDDIKKGQEILLLGQSSETAKRKGVLGNIVHNYPDINGQLALFKGQDSSYCGSGGDSGAPIVSKNSDGTVKLMGIMVHSEVTFEDIAYKTLGVDPNDALCEFIPIYVAMSQFGGQPFVKRNFQKNVNTR